MESYIGYVLPFVPGCPEALVERKLLEAARALCDDAWCWRKKQESTIAADATTLALGIDSTAELSDVPEFARDGRNSIDYEISGTDIIIPAWSAESTIKLTMAQRPPITATELPAGFKSIRYQKVTEALAEMTKAILHSMKDQAWHDPREAVTDKSAYDFYVGKIRAQILRPNPMAEMRIIPRPFV
ncbi:MAG: hypothetical protein DRH26_03655 [Deltaproteobacteria bacterium]|nr:MAG: hypothetical protein DRH26_03655 [Deltaproteobacteria bacterium]